MSADDIAIGDTFERVVLGCDNDSVPWEVTERIGDNVSAYWLRRGDGSRIQMASDLLDATRWRRVRCR
jgi:hypothetical protein